MDCTFRRMLFRTSRVGLVPLTASAYWGWSEAVSVPTIEIELW